MRYRARSRYIHFSNTDGVDWCGPADLFSKMFKATISCKEALLRLLSDHSTLHSAVGSSSSKVYRRMYSAATALLSTICSPRSFHFIFLWILFENAMAMHRAKATIIGRLERNRVYEWIVTAKLRNLQEIRAVLDHRKDISMPHHTQRIHLMESHAAQSVRHVQSLSHLCRFVRPPFFVMDSATSVYMFPTDDEDEDDAHCLGQY